MTQLRMSLSQDQLARFCKRWQITEFAVFGSVLRDDFGPESDVDVLVTFAPEASWSLLDHLRMEQELSDLLRRRIDLFTRKAVEQNHNWLRRQEILGTAQAVYRA